MVKVSKTKLPGLLLIQLDAFRDHRGVYVGTYDEARYRKLGIRVKFVEDDYSRSRRRVLRGIHADSKSWKLISCPLGRILVVIVNCNRRSRRFGRWQAFELSEKNCRQLLVPPKHGVVHLVLSRQAMFSYKQSEYYDPKRQATYRWDDPAFKIRWPVRNPILSKRDRLGHYV
ncbi:MAG: dTDP-4-dehydrorhamnose 3,5-epimerase family protein [Patescibacteria group bacterium]